MGFSATMFAALRHRRLCTPESIVGGGGLPDGAVVQRDGDAIVDRSGNYVINVAQS